MKLIWYGFRPQYDDCGTCGGSGYLDGNTGLPTSPHSNASAILCRSCTGRGLVEVGPRRHEFPPSYDDRSRAWTWVIAIWLAVAIAGLILARAWRLL